MGRTATISELPAKPAVYALMGGSGRNRHVAYVGIAGKLKGRITQHLVLRDSSVATGTSAVGLVPEHVREVAWWDHSSFEERRKLEAAEIVAFGVLDPALRSRGAPESLAREQAGEPEFEAEMRALFVGRPTGRLRIPSLLEALARIRSLEKRVAELEGEEQA